MPGANAPCRRELVPDPARTMLASTMHPLLTTISTSTTLLRSKGHSSLDTSAQPDHGQSTPSAPTLAEAARPQHQLHHPHAPASLSTTAPPLAGARARALDPHCWGDHAHLRRARQIHTTQRQPALSPRLHMLTGNTSNPLLPQAQPCHAEPHTSAKRASPDAARAHCEMERGPCRRTGFARRW